MFKEKNSKLNTITFSFSFILGNNLFNNLLGLKFSDYLCFIILYYLSLHIFKYDNYIKVKVFNNNKLNENYKNRVKRLSTI